MSDFFEEDCYYEYFMEELFGLSSEEDSPISSPFSLQPLPDFFNRSLLPSPPPKVEEAQANPKATNLVKDHPKNEAESKAEEIRLSGPEHWKHFVETTDCGSSRLFRPCLADAEKMKKDWNLKVVHFDSGEDYSDILLTQEKNPREFRLSFKPKKQIKAIHPAANHNLSLYLELRCGNEIIISPAFKLVSRLPKNNQKRKVDKPVAKRTSKRTRKQADLDDSSEDEFSKWQKTH